MKKGLTLAVIVLLAAGLLSSCFSVKLPQKDIPVIAAEPSPVPSQMSTPVPSSAPTPIPALTSSPAPSPTPALSTQQDNTLIVANMDMILKYPDGWTVLTNDQINQFYAKNIEFLKSQFTDSQAFENAVQENIPISVAMKHPMDYTIGFNATINVLVKPVPAFLTKDIVALAKEAINVAKSSVSADVTFSKPVKAKIGKRNGAMCDIKYKALGLTIDESQYYIAKDGYVAIITCAWMDKADKKVLQSIIKSIQFDADWGL